MDALIKKINKLEFQMKLVGESLNSEENPIATLVIALNWGDEELDEAHDIFENFDTVIERGDSPNWGQFEKDFIERLNINYQSLKLVIISFYRNFQWREVCIQYAKAHECIEFNFITRNISAEF